MKMNQALKTLIIVGYLACGMAHGSLPIIPFAPLPTMSQEVELPPGFNKPTAVQTDFDPFIDGLQFINTGYVNNVIGDIDFYARCGGMVHLALDHYGVRCQTPSLVT